MARNDTVVSSTSRASEPLEQAGLLAGMAALSGSDSGQSDREYKQTLMALMAELAGMSRDRREKEKQEEAERLRAKELAEQVKVRIKADVKKSHQAGVDELRRDQMACPHRSPAPWNMSELIGANFISGKQYLYCQACRKEFNTPELRDWANSRGLIPSSRYIAAKPVPE